MMRFEYAHDLFQVVRKQWFPADKSGGDGTHLCGLFSQ
jgi:hypothetical protein